MTSQHSSEEPQDQWRGVVGWLLCRREILNEADRILCEELISLVVIAEEQEAALTRAIARAISATGVGYPAALRLIMPPGSSRVSRRRPE
jgi:hypothetical protein